MPKPPIPPDLKRCADCGFAAHMAQDAGAAQLEKECCRRSKMSAMGRKQTQAAGLRNVARGHFSLQLLKVRTGAGADVPHP